MNGTRERVLCDSHSGPREMAARIQQENPGWVVMWSPYYRELFAFPCFSVPKGTVLHYPDPGQLVAEMFSVQKAAAQAWRVVAGSAGGGMWRASEGLSMGFVSANDERGRAEERKSGNSLGDSRVSEDRVGTPGLCARDVTSDSQVSGISRRSQKTLA